MALQDTQNLLAAYQAQVANKIAQKEAPQQFVDPRADWELEDSAIKSGWNRVKWGASDLNGKMRILTEGEGYSPDQIVQLKNGELGVKTPRGIKPVDPKGFQMSDLMGDVGESLATLPVIGGQMAGAGVGGLLGPAGSIAGAGAGAGMGEYSRQKLGEFLGVRDKGMSDEEFREIAITGLLGAGSQAASLGVGKLLSSFNKAGSVKGAAGGTGGTGGQVTTTVANKINDHLGMKTTNSDITTNFFNKLTKGKVQVVEHLDDLAEQTNAGLTNLIENRNDVLFKKFLEPQLKEQAIKQGVQNLDDVTFSLSPTKQGLATLRKEILSSQGMLKSQKTQALSIIDDAINTFKGNKVTTYGSFKEATGNLANLIKQAQNAGDNNTANLYSKIYGTLVDSRAKTLPQQAFKDYSQSRATLNKLEQLFRVKMSEGEIRPGQMDLVGKLSKFSDEIKHAKNYRTLQELIGEAKNIGIEGAEQLSDDVDSFLFNNALSKAKYKPGALGKIVKGIPIVSGIAQVGTEWATTPASQARMLGAGMKMGIIDPKALTSRVGERFFPRINTLLKLANVPETGAGKALSPVLNTAGKVTVKARGAIAGQSLNNILYKKDVRQ